MKFIFTKNVTAYQEDHRKGDIVDVDPEHIDTLICLREGWLIEVQEHNNISKRVVKRKKKNESI